MDGQMMDFQLTLPHILKRAELYFGRGEIVTRLPDKSFHRTTYADTMRRSKQLAVALKQLGLADPHRWPLLLREGPQLIHARRLEHR